MYTDTSGDDDDYLRDRERLLKESETPEYLKSSYVEDEAVVGTKRREEREKEIEVQWEKRKSFCRQKFIDVLVVFSFLGLNVFINLYNKWVYR